MGYICKDCGWSAMLGAVEIKNHQKKCCGEIRRTEMYEIHAVDFVLDAKDSIINAYVESVIRYKQALHDAINSPEGVVPKSAEGLYDQGYYDEVEK